MFQYIDGILSSGRNAYTFANTISLDNDARKAIPSHRTKVLFLIDKLRLLSKADEVFLQKFLCQEQLSILC
jgi:hypothetical protein